MNLLRIQRYGELCARYVIATQPDNLTIDGRIDQALERGRRFLEGARDEVHDAFYAGVVCVVDAFEATEAAAMRCRGTGLEVKVAVGANVVVPRSVVCPECTRRLRATTSLMRDGRKWFHRVPAHQPRPSRT